MNDMRLKITIPKTGKDIGKVIVEGMEEKENCRQILEEVAVRFGNVGSVEPKDHFGDDNPVYHDVDVR